MHRDRPTGGIQPDPASEEPLAPHQPLALRAVKAVALVLAVSLLALLAVRLARWVAGAPASLLVAAAGAVAGYVLADLVSGTVHWFCDTFFAEDTPLIGPTIIRPFRDHHRHPEAILRYRLLEQDGTNYVILVLPLWLAAGLEASPPLLPLAGLGSLWGFGVGSLCTNLFHKWAHSPRPPRVIRWLQRRRLVLSPEAHAVHHRSYSGGYCVTSGWLNPLLDRLDAFGRVERVVRLLGQVAACRRAGGA